MQRTEIKQILERWQSLDDEEIDELAVWRWAGEKVQWVGENEVQLDELSRDLLDLLAALPWEMVVVEDVPVFLDALANPTDETDLSVNLLWNHMDGVDVDTRRLQYADHKFYSQFTNAD